MDRQAFVAGIIPAFFLYACGHASPGTAGSSGQTPDTVSEQAAATPTMVDETAAGTPTAAPAPPSPAAARSGGSRTDSPSFKGRSQPLGPAMLTPAADKTVTGATNVLLSFARALELRAFDQAWAMLDKSDQAKWPKAQFTRMFADLGKITVGFDRGTMEGAAGSSYYTAPIHLTSTDRAGRPVRYDGEAVLRRVNDVPGATPAQLRWHFEKVTLDWTH